MLTKEQKWMNRLERCLKDMPEGCELFVSLYLSDTSLVSLLDKGAASDQKDVIQVNNETRRANEFIAKRVIGHSEGF